VHEKEKRGGGKEHDGSSDHSASHSACVATALYFLNRSQGCLLPIYKTHIIDIHIELAAPSHSTFVLRLSHGRQRKATTRDNNDVLHFNIFQDLEVNAVPSRGVSRGGFH
jgi:hypothetical protein